MMPTKMVNPKNEENPQKSAVSEGLRYSEPSDLPARLVILPNS